MTYQQNKFKNVILILIGLLVFGTSCYLFPASTKKNQEIQPPVIDADIPFNEYLIYPDSSISINLPTGTTIKISPAVFEREDGKPIEGAIAFKVREFHSAYDILRAGIPMSTDADRRNFLQSAGMIELRANNNGKVVKLKEGKQLEVALAGYKLSDGYDLYYTADGSNWAITDRFVTDSNTRRNTRLRELSIIPQSPLDSGEITKDFIVSLQVDLTALPYLKPFANLQWRIAKKDINSQVIAAMRIIWDDVAIREISRRKLKYELVFKKKLSLTSDSEMVQQLVVKASPITGGKNKREDRRIFADQMATYKIILAKVEEEKSRLLQEASMLNSFKISKMGIWNIDRLMKSNDMFFVNVSFDFEKQINRDINNLKVFVIYEDENSVLPYAAKEWTKIGFRPNLKVSLVVVLPKNEIALVTSEQLQQQLKTSTQTLLFKTKRVGGVEFLKNFKGSLP
jgi:hypothetical protein